MQPRVPECSVVIPVFNKWELTRACLASLREHTAGHDLEVIVVDNGSSDATATELAPYGSSLFGKRFSAVVFPENKNFGPACNAGARAAISPVLFFLNNDTILTPGWLPPLLEALREDGDSSAVGPLLLYEDGSVQHLGVGYGTRGPFHLYQHFPADHPVIFKKRELQAITGAALMIRADFFRECGEFFEEYRNGFEDLDLCVQVRRRGGTLRCVAASRIYHLESQTPGRKDGDDHNGAIFTGRCGADVYTDIHHHALRDGFSIFISDLLTIGINLKEKDEVAVTEKAQGGDAPAWLRLTQEHPFWIHGREVLAQSLEREKLYAEAVRFRAELTEIEPLVSRYRDLLRLAPFAGETPWLGTAEKHLNIMMQYTTDRALALNAVQEIRQRFRRDGEPVLEQAFAAKLQEWFPQK
ncbi:Glycosyl transferase family 2 [uncultured delta proteobacterium]|uniref:Glycosyl transferase family 2 n=1 Tax=uncultured delta proteobacterium TaxID=34034 RepID=A0A212J4T7_9DELT|nr:Glycosyl transferase family 2 [uncultured delta proteobacterium]